MIDRDLVESHMNSALSGIRRDLGRRVTRALATIAMTAAVAACLSDRARLDLDGIEVCPRREDVLIYRPRGDDGGLPGSQTGYSAVVVIVPPEAMRARVPDFAPTGLHGQFTPSTIHLINADTAIGFSQSVRNLLDLIDADDVEFEPFADTGLYRVNTGHAFGVDDFQPHRRWVLVTQPERPADLTPDNQFDWIRALCSTSHTARERCRRTLVHEGLRARVRLTGENIRLIHEIEQAATDLISEWREACSR